MRGNKKQERTREQQQRDQDQNRNQQDRRSDESMDKNRQQPVSNPHQSERTDQRDRNDASTTKGNLFNTGRSRDEQQLHTKRSATGADDDGQSQ